MLIQMGLYQASQAVLELLTAGDLLASASQSAEIIGVSHTTPAKYFIIKYDVRHTLSNWKNSFLL